MTPPVDDAALPSAVWTRPPAAWRAGLRTAGATLGGVTPAFYLLFIRTGLLSWPAALAIDVGSAAAAGLLVTWWTWARRARLLEMLDTAAVLPWFAGAGFAATAGLGLGGLLGPRSGFIAIAAGTVAAVAWTSGFLLWWRRRHPAPMAHHGKLR